MSRVLPLLRLTDEELLVMNALHPAVTTPYLDEVPQEQHRLVAQTAYRSLRAHGVERTDDGAGLVLPEAVVSMLQVRAAAGQVLVISHSRPSGVGVRYHHIGAEIVVLEDVSTDGDHDFALVDRAGLRAGIGEFVADLLADPAPSTVSLAPPRPVDGSGPPVCLSPAALAEGAVDESRWGQVLLQLDTTCWSATCEDPPTLLGFLLGSAGTWCSRNVVGDVGDVVLRPAKVAEVATAIAASVDGPQQPAASTGSPPTVADALY